MLRELKEAYDKASIQVDGSAKEASFDLEIYRHATGKIEKRRVGYYHRNPIKRFFGRLKIAIADILR